MVSYAVCLRVVFMRNAGRYMRCHFPFVGCSTGDILGVGGRNTTFLCVSLSQLVCVLKQILSINN